MTSGAPARRRRVFRNIPGFFVGFVCLEIFFLYPLYLFVVAQPEQRTTTATVLVLTLVPLAELGVGWVIFKLWQTAWRFTFSDTHLIAVHRLRGRCLEIPWTAIKRVAKEPLPWWNRDAEAGFTRIELANGEVILIAPHLNRYPDFLAEVRARSANCQTFDPYIFP